jgi:hypothetical protein
MKEPYFGQATQAKPPAPHDESSTGEHSWAFSLPETLSTSSQAWLKWEGIQLACKGLIALRSTAAFQTGNAWKPRQKCAADERCCGSLSWYKKSRDGTLKSVSSEDYGEQQWHRQPLSIRRPGAGRPENVTGYASLITYVPFGDRLGLPTGQPLRRGYRPARTSFSRLGCRSSTMRSFTSASGGLVLPFS